MTGEDVIASLALPSASRVGRRVPKSLLLEHGAPTASDKRRISDGIEQIEWVAALKPTTIGIAAYRDDVREYLEIAVLHVVLRGQEKGERLLELVHRAIPYPVLAVVSVRERLLVSAANKRRSQVEAQKTVLDGDIITVDLRRGDDGNERSFLAAFSLDCQPHSSLWELYQGWFDTLLALEAARVSGRFSILTNDDSRQARREALRDAIRLELDIARLRTQAKGEKQMARRVAINLAMKRLESERAVALSKL